MFSISKNENIVQKRISIIISTLDLHIEGVTPWLLREGHCHYDCILNNCKEVWVFQRKVLSVPAGCCALGDRSDPINKVSMGMLLGRAPCWDSHPQGLQADLGASSCFILSLFTEAGGLFNFISHFLCMKCSFRRKNWKSSASAVQAGSVHAMWRWAGEF